MPNTQKCTKIFQVELVYNSMKLCGERYAEVELELDILLNMIEESRRRMNESARDRSLTDPDVVQISQGLDRLLNQYYEMVYRAG